MNFVHRAYRRRRSPTRPRLSLRLGQISLEKRSAIAFINPIHLTVTNSFALERSASAYAVATWRALVAPVHKFRNQLPGEGMR